MAIIPIKCDCCGEMTDCFSDRSAWFGKFLEDGENRICRKCIGARQGYADEFFKHIGIPLGELNYK